jgi:hypothetical protein
MAFGKETLMKFLSLNYYFKFCFVLGALLVSWSLRADAREPGVTSIGKFGADLDAIPELILQCRRQRSCDPKLIVKILAKQDVGSEEKRSLLPRFLFIAGIQAEIWDDTILEGPYEAEKSLALDRIEGFFQNGQLIAYRITFSARAWHLGRGGVRKEEGRIVESAFVSLSLKGFIRDESAIAEFRAQK